MIRLTPVVRNLIILNVFVFVVLLLFGTPEIQAYFHLNKANLLGLHETTTIDFNEYYPISIRPDSAPYGPQDFHWIQILTHFFNHGGVMHILFNMLALSSLGSIIEYSLGSRRFLSFYLFCGIVGGMLMAFFDPSVIPVVGASGAISGIIVAFAVYFPNQKLSFFFLPPLPSRTMAMLLGGISLILVLLQYKGYDVGGNISHFGHLAGMIAAMIWFYVLPLIERK